jgi:predicted DNA-binding transcriptional regulator AlpA
MRFLDEPAVAAKTALSRSTIRRLMDQDVSPFPKPFRPDPSRVRIVWNEAEVDAWMQRAMTTAQAHAEPLKTRNPWGRSGKPEHLLTNAERARRAAKANAKQAA